MRCCAGYMTVPCFVTEVSLVHQDELSLDALRDMLWDVLQQRCEISDFHYNGTCMAVTCRLFCYSEDDTNHVDIRRCNSVGWTVTEIHVTQFYGVTSERYRLN